jgi:hypothetical protein
LDPEQDRHHAFVAGRGVAHPAGVTVDQHGPEAIGRL